MMRRAQLCLRLAQAQNIQLRKENVELKAKFEAKPEVKK